MDALISESAVAIPRARAGSGAASEPEEVYGAHPAASAIAAVRIRIGRDRVMSAEKIASSAG
jgi:hypothetical protein